MWSWTDENCQKVMNFKAVSAICKNQAVTFHSSWIYTLYLPYHANCMNCFLDSKVTWVFLKMPPTPSSHIFPRGMYLMARFHWKIFLMGVEWYSILFDNRHFPMFIVLFIEQCYYGRVLGVQQKRLFQLLISNTY